MSWLTIVLVLLVLQGVILSLFVLLEQRHPMATLAWVLTLVLLPLVGALMYYFFGRMRFHRRRKLRARALEPLQQAHSRRQDEAAATTTSEPQPALSEPQPVSPELHPATPAPRRIAWRALDALARSQRSEHRAGAVLPPTTPPPASQYRPQHLPQVQRDSTAVYELAQRIIPARATHDNRVQVLCNGDPTFAAIGEAISEATHHIHVLYYIFREDQTGTWLRDLLVAQAQRGIEVRLLYDAIGCYGTTDIFFQPLRDAGARVAEFMPLRFQWPLRKSYLNFRNHRKMVIVDGKEGFTGGINVGDEYRGKSETLGFWRDTHIGIKGPAVHYLQHVFAEDWCQVTDELLTAPVYYPFEGNAPPEALIPPTAKASPPEVAYPFGESGDQSSHDAMVQIVPSGPDQQWYPIRLLFFVAITSARERVWLTTPYFIPDGAILTALVTTALRGVDVRLLLPAKADSRFVRYAGRSYYRRLLRAGVRIFEYHKGMLHAKTMVVDGHYGTIGSANLDMRSFHINFEINAFVYETTVAQELEAQFVADLQDAQEIERIAFSKRPLKERLLEASARIFSPLL